MSLRIQLANIMRTTVRMDEQNGAAFSLMALLAPTITVIVYVALSVGDRTYCSSVAITQPVIEWQHNVTQNEGETRASSPANCSLRAVPVIFPAEIYGRSVIVRPGVEVVAYTLCSNLQHCHDITLVRTSMTDELTR